MSYRKQILAAIKDTHTRDKFAKDLERNDRLAATSNGKLNDLRAKLRSINAEWAQMGSVSTPSQVSMNILHSAFQGQEQLSGFIAQFIHPTAQMPSCHQFMKHFNQLNELTQKLMEESLKSIQIQYERALIVNDVKNYIAEQDKSRLAGINALERSVSSSGMYLMQPKQ